MNVQTGIISIHGKDYHTVAKRVRDFRDEYPEHSLTTEIIARDNLVTMRAIIADPSGRVIATGHAEEDRSKGQINRTSALENCETSAIGRALAAFGIGGTEFASANEVENAIHQQREGHSQEGAVSPPAIEMPDAEWAKLTQLVEASGANVPAMLKHLKINLQNDNLKLLNQEQYGRVIEALNDKLAKMAKEETNAKAKEDA